MRLRALSALLVGCVPLACATPAAERGGAEAGALPGWAPRVPEREEQDRREVEALLAALEQADAAGSAEAVAALLEFPLLMVTDDRRGVAVATTWSRQRWIEAMGPISGPLPGVEVRHRASIFVLSDALAVVCDDQTVTRRGRSLPGRAALVVVRTSAGWRVKAILEAGWGEMMRRLERDVAPPAGR